MEKQRTIKWISIGLILIMAGYLSHSFMTEWPNIRKGFYSGYYSGRANVPHALQDVVNNRFEIRLLSTRTSNDTLVGGPGAPALILKPESIKSGCSVRRRCIGKAAEV